MKISIMGYSGAGKTTLANQLAAQYGCGVLHLDRVNFTHGWRERDRAEAQQMLEETLAQADWVIDGNYANLCIDRRLAQSDRIILLMFPRRVCFFRAVKRYLRYRGRTRPDIGEGCEEKFDPEFAKWILWEGRSRQYRERLLDCAQKYPEKAVVICSPRRLHRFLKQNQA